MYRVTHIDPNGCQDVVGEFATEGEARNAAEKQLRDSCSLDEQLDHFIQAFNLSPEISVTDLVKILQGLQDDQADIVGYCDDFNDDAKNAIEILGPAGFEVVYWADLSFSVMHGFYYEISCNG